MTNLFNSAINCPNILLLYLFNVLLKHLFVVQVDILQQVLIRMLVKRYKKSGLSRKMQRMVVTVVGDEVMTLPSTGIVDTKTTARKIHPAHTMITKRDFILCSSCFCEKYDILSTAMIAVRITVSF